MFGCEYHDVKQYNNGLLGKKNTILHLKLQRMNAVNAQVQVINAQVQVQSQVLKISGRLESSESRIQQPCLLDVQSAEGMILFSCQCKTDTTFQNVRFFIWYKDNNLCIFVWRMGGKNHGTPS